VRLDPGTTKNKEGRSFPFTAALETLLLTQLAEHEQSKKADGSCPTFSLVTVSGSALRDRRFGRAEGCRGEDRSGRGHNTAHNPRKLSSKQSRTHRASRWFYKCRGRESNPDALAGLGF
jgi:hypothetical protein